MLNTLLMGPPQPGASMWPNLIFIGGIVFVFYFLMYRPQQKKMKEQKQFIEELKKGDRIVTTGGIHGKIVEMNDLTLVIQSSESKLKIERSAVSIDLTKAHQNTPESEKA